MSGVLSDLFGGGDLLTPGTDSVASTDTFSTNINGGGGGNTGSLLGAAGGLAGVAGNLLGSQANAQAATDEASAYGQEASLYNQAATLAGQDITLAGVSGQLQGAALTRSIAETEGTAAAAEATNNVGGYLPNGSAAAGSGAYILAESQRNGALATGQLNLQTQLQENNFAEMQQGFQAQAAGATAAQKAAEAAASASSGGGILGALGSIAGIASKLIPLF